MQLIKCNIENFGKLSNQTINFNSGLNVFFEENGWGKTTLATFIKVMFYGFEDETKRNRLEKERERFRPWQGGRFGGSIEFVVEDKEYILYRFFDGKKKSDDEFILRDRMSNLNSSDYSENIGEEIFGIDSVSFMKSIYLTQNICATNLTDNINSKLGNVTENDEYIKNYDSIIKKLNDDINKLSPNRKTGELSKLEDKITKLKLLVEQKNNLENELRALENKEYSTVAQAKIENNSSQIFEDDFEEIIEEYIEEWEECKELKAGISSKKLVLKNLNASNNNLKDNGNSKLYLLLGSILIIIGIFLFFKNNYFGIVSIAGFILAAFGILTKGKAFDNNSYDELSEEIEKDEEDIQSITEKTIEFLKEYGIICQERAITNRLYQLKGKYEKYIENNNNKQNNYYEELKREKLKSLDNVKDSDILLNEAICKRDELSEKYYILEETKKTLELAKNNYNNKYMSPLFHSFIKYFNYIDKESEFEFVLNSNGEVNVKEYGMEREAVFFSQGYRDLIGICMRMSYINTMYDIEIPFLIMDDPFVNLDKNKISKAMDFLEEISREYQIIYFTCHESRL